VEEVVLSELKKYCSGVGTEWVKDDQTNTYTFLIKEKKQAPI
jgi:hypothetical protein